MTALVIRAFPLPAMYALDEHGPWLEPEDGQGPHPRSVSEFTWHPGVPAVLDMTDPQFPQRRVLLDVDTLRTTRMDRAELEGKFELPYDRDAVRAHIEQLVEINNRLRFRYDTKVTARALRRLAAGGAKSTWPIGERLDPEHPLENEHWIRPTGLNRGPRHERKPRAPEPPLRWPGRQRSNVWPPSRLPETVETPPPPPEQPRPARRCQSDYDRLVERTLDAWPEFRRILGEAS